MAQTSSTIARLLSTENIEVRHGNFETAFFDVNNRTLGLPPWSDQNPDLYTMLVGHEVGHALETPSDGWTQAQQGDDKVPGDYLNVVEDIRIERKIQERYPGIVRSFKKGYQHLADEDFFGIKDQNVNTLGLMDRINLKAKLRDLIDVYFSPDEQPLVDQAFAADTWDDVVEAARALQKYVKEQSIEGDGTESKRFMKSDDGEGDPLTEDEDSSNEVESHDPQDSNPGDSSQDSDVDGSDDNSDQKENEETGEDGFQSGGSAGDPEKVDTLQNAAKRLPTLNERNSDGRIPNILYSPTREQMNAVTVPFETVSAARKEMRAQYEYHHSEYLHNVLEEHNRRYKVFLTESKPVVNMMAKEFELRKAAYQYSRASTARSGSLDMEKLHEYKINDDIFNRVTRLADSKSHGLVMLVDNSASMREDRPQIISQVMVLVMFCKRVGIPFEVYSFTNFDWNDNDARQSVNGVDTSEFALTQLVSSSLKKEAYNRAMHELFLLKSNLSPFCRGKHDRMSGTPLNPLLTGMHHNLKQFKSKHQIQNLSFMVLSDGASVNLSYCGPSGMSFFDPYTLKFQGTNHSIRVPEWTSPFQETEAILKGLKAVVPGLTTIGYFVASNKGIFNDILGKVRDSGADDLTNTERSKAVKVTNQYNHLTFDNTLGCDRYFILRVHNSRTFEAKSDTLEVSENAKRSEITKAFKKYSNSKKSSRIMASKFAEVIS